MQDDYDAAEKGASEALENYRELNDERGIGSALHTLAEVEHRKGNFESANSLYQEAFVHLTAAQHSIGMVYCLSNRGLLARQRGDLILADNLLKEAGQQAEILRDTNASAQIMIEQAWLSIARRRPGTAEQLFRDAARRKEDEGDAHGSCQARLGVGTSLLIQEHYAEARQVFEQALRDAHSLRARIFIVDALFGMSAALTGIEEFKAAIASFVLAESTAGALSSETFKSLAREIARKQISAVLHQDVEEWSRHGTCDPYRDPETTLSNIRALVNRADN
jgi:tetratricopeptide (TPR) repeat protein